MEAFGMAPRYILIERQCFRKGGLVGGIDPKWGQAYRLGSLSSGVEFIERVTGRLCTTEGGTMDEAP